MPASSVMPVTASSAGRRLLADTAGAGAAAGVAGWAAGADAAAGSVLSSFLLMLVLGFGSLSGAGDRNCGRGVTLVAAAQRTGQGGFGAQVARLHVGCRATLRQHVGLGRQHDQVVAQTVLIALHGQ